MLKDDMKLSRRLGLLSRLKLLRQLSVFDLFRFELSLKLVNLQLAETNMRRDLQKAVKEAVEAASRRTRDEYRKPLPATKYEHEHDPAIKVEISPSTEKK